MRHKTRWASLVPPLAASLAPLLVIVTLCVGMALVLTPVRAQQTNPARPEARPASSANPAGDLDKFCGVYELAPDRFLYIEHWPAMGPATGSDSGAAAEQGRAELTFTDDAGTVRGLFPDSKNHFTAGPGLMVRTPTQLSFQFIPDSKGQIARLIFQQAGSPPRTARKLVSYRREVVHFQSGPERLAGILLTPPGKGPHPALVLVHGTGATDRYTVLPIVEFLLSHGMALLGYDKRGVGESSGDWHAASLDELASDAVAAVQFLKTRQEIDPRRIGIFGASQGGWIAPLAASRSPDVAYIITVSGPALSPAQVDQDLLERALRARQFPEAEIEQALDFLRLRDAAVRGDQNMDTLLSALATASGEKWFPYTSMPKTINRALLAHWRRLPLDYDPGPVISKLRAPALVMFGELDQTVVPEKNAAAWRAELQQGGARDFAIKIFPRANHMLLEAGTGSNEELPLLGHFTSGYAPFLLAWLQKHSILRP